MLRPLLYEIRIVLPQLVLGIASQGKDRGYAYPKISTVSDVLCHTLLINLSAGFNPDYTGRKNIYYKGTIMGMGKSEIDSIIGDIEEFVELGEYFDRPVRMYSSGMSARLGFALAVYCNPDILIVDEVLAVGDKSFQNKSRAKIMELFKAGKAVLFSSHSDVLIRQFCNRIIYIRDGKIAYDGDVEEGLKLYNEDISKKGTRLKKDISTSHFPKSFMPLHKTMSLLSTSVFWSS